MIFSKIPKELNTNDVVAVLLALKGSRGVVRYFDFCVRQVAEKHRREWHEQQINNIVRGMVEEWNTSFDDKIFEIMSDEK